MVIDAKKVIDNYWRKTLLHPKCDVTTLGLHDNNPKQTARISKEYLTHQKESNVLQIMPLPLQSTDLDPIELLWSQLDRRIRKVYPT